MNILIVDKSTIPVYKYGGTQRVIWSLGKELTKLGHTVTFLVNKGSFSNFASIIFINPKTRIIDQIPKDVDVVHFNFVPNETHLLEIPYLITMHGNTNDTNHVFDKNTVFISKNHAERYNSNTYVYNGLDWSEYSKPNLTKKRSSFHFLGKGSWGVKNLKGAIDIIKKTKSEHLNVMGANRFEKRVLKFGLPYVLSSRVRYKGMLGGSKKELLLNDSKGLIFPVRWHEPFGLAIIESLYYGCPIFGSTYGSLREIVNNEIGFLSNKKNKISNHLENSYDYSPKICHEYAVEKFNSKKMALNYLNKYEKLISGKELNKNNPRLIKNQKERFLEFN